MKLKISKPFWQVVGLGVLAGMRTNSAPAIASHVLSHHQSRALERSPLSFMQSDKVAMALKGLAVVEFAAVRSPKAPDKIKPAGLMFRCISGSLVGASIYKASGGNAVIGSVVGGVTALGASFGSFYLRRDSVSKKYLMDPIAGALEDALVIGAGLSIVNAV